MATINEAATKQADEDNNDIAHELLHDSVTKQSFAAMLESAKTGSDILKVADLLPNSSQRDGHSITMNALIKIIVRHLIF
jgi:hypothetical protein